MTKSNLAEGFKFLGTFDLFLSEILSTSNNIFHTMFSQWQLMLVVLALVSFATQVLGLNLPQGSELQGKRSIEVRDGVEHTIFEYNGSSIDFVKNSGICETTPGVNQYSGYFSVGRMSHCAPYYA
jgi:hypothetical protein